MPDERDPKDKIGTESEFRVDYGEAPFEAPSEPVHREEPEYEPEPDPEPEPEKRKDDE